MNGNLKRILICISLLALLFCCIFIMTACGECDHSFVDEKYKTEPTCEKNGVLTRRCELCDETFTWIIDSSPEYHKYQTSSFKAPECDKSGIETKVCTVCGNTGYVEIPALGHSYTVNESVNPTCTADGYSKSTCTKCAHVNEVIFPAKHSYSTSTVTLAPTCSTEGKEEFTCTVCGVSGVNTLPKTEHTPAISVKSDPTCQKSGLTEGSICTVCLATLSGREVIPQVDHKFEGDSVSCVWCEAPKSYTVSYVSEGAADFPSSTYSHGDTFLPPDTSALENESTVFVGWFDEGGNRYTSATVITASVTLYARFDTYVPVSDADGLRAIANAPDKHYVLTKNIDAEGVIWTPIDNFSGTIDGGGFAIYNIILNTTEQKDFGFVRVNNGTIKNLTFKDFTFNTTVTPVGTLNFGVVAGQNNGNISNVEVKDGTVMLTANRQGANDSYYVSFGLIAGSSGEGAIINNCRGAVNISFSIATTNSEYQLYWAASMWGYYYLGGVVGRNAGELSGASYEGKITLEATATSAHASYANDHYASNTIYLGGTLGENTGAVNESYSRASLALTGTRNRVDARNFIYTGVFAGNNLSGGVIEHCYTAGEIYSNTPNTNYVGGFIGLNSENSSVKSCYTTADAQAVGEAFLGGFVGSNSGIVQNSYSTGDTLSENSGRTGGFVGSLNSSGSVSKSYSAGNVTAGGGEVGRFLGHAEGTVLKCYFMDSSTVMSGGTYLPTVTEYNTIEGIVYTKLWNEDFLINEMYWEESGWIVLVDENHVTFSARLP